MESRIVNLTTLFNDQVSYWIPQFQRPYAWRRANQWEPLWSDIREKCEDVVRIENGRKVLPHFLGAIVLQPLSSSTGVVSKSLVVDGQQRLTTLQLLMKAAQQAFYGINLPDAAERLRQLLQNSSNNWGGDSSNETKIRQSNENDQGVFQNVMRETYDPEGYPRAIGVAFSYFKEAIKSWLDEIPEEREERAAALEETLSRHLQVAAIDLDDNEKPHVIFEVLNTRGEALKQSDLVKNTIMYEAGVVDDPVKAKQLWGMFDSNEWWREETKEGRLVRIQLDRFLNYYIVMTTLKDTTADRVSASFSNYVAEEKQNIFAIAEDLRKSGSVYEDIVRERTPGIEEALRRFGIIGVGVIVPPLMWLFSNDVPPAVRLRCVDALESFLIRRMLCGLPSHGLNNFFLELLNRLEAREYGEAENVVVGFLEGTRVENRLWPNDRLLIESLAQRPMQGTVARKKMVLEAIEKHMRSDLTEPLVVGTNTKLTLEHVMPQSWQRHWPLPQEHIGDAAAIEERGEAIKCIGNLTLTTGKLNANLSNGPWPEKRQTLDKHSILLLNRNLLRHAGENWDELGIRVRSNHLARICAEIWPSPESFVNYLT